MRKGELRDVTRLNGNGAGHPATDAGALEKDRTSTNDRLPDKASPAGIQAPVDQFAAELISYGEIADRLQALQPCMARGTSRWHRPIRTP